MHPGTLPVLSFPVASPTKQGLRYRKDAPHKMQLGNQGRQAGEVQHSQLLELEPSCALALHYRCDNEAEERPCCKKHRRNKRTVSVA